MYTRPPSCEGVRDELRLKIFNFVLRFLFEFVGKSQGNTKGRKHTCFRYQYKQSICFGTTMYEGFR